MNPQCPECNNKEMIPIRTEQFGDEMVRIFKCTVYQCPGRFYGAVA